MLLDSYFDEDVCVVFEFGVMFLSEEIVSVFGFGKDYIIEFGEFVVSDVWFVVFVVVSDVFVWYDLFWGVFEIECVYVFFMCEDGEGWVYYGVGVCVEDVGVWCIDDVDVSIYVRFCEKLLKLRILLEYVK